MTASGLDYTPRRGIGCEYNLMGTRKALANNDEQRNAIRALGLLALVLWAGCCYRQSLPYPFYGALWCGMLALLGVLTSWLLLAKPPYKDAPLTALGSAFAFACWAVLRWIAEGATAAGIENVITILTWCAWLFVAAHLACFMSASEDTSPHESSRPPRKFLLWAFGSVALIASLFAIYAIAQYAVLYDLQLKELRASIGTRNPTPVELGLIHHLQLKRVASVWGDPNAFGCFCVFGLGAAFYLWRESRLATRPLLQRSSAAVATALCAAGIVLSGSRGALLDAVVFCGVAAVCRWRWRALLTVALGVAIWSATIAQAADPLPHHTPKPATTSWWTRSDTIRERVYYAQIGWEIFKQSPIVGAGPGAVEVFYGRLKPAEARESKYLHNWFLQVGAELGVVGLALFVTALGAIAKRLGHLGRSAPNEAIVFAGLFAMFLVDSFVELSFNQRELMATFGAMTGLALGLSGRCSASVDAHSNSRAHAGLAAMTLAISLGMALVALPRSLRNGFLQLAEGHLVANEDLLASDYLRRAQRWSLGDPDVYVFQAALARAKGDSRAEEEALRRALELAPWSANLHVQLAEALERRGETTAAEELLRRAVNLYPTKAEHWHEMAAFLERQGRLEEALDAAGKAVKFSYLYPQEDRALLQRIEAKLSADSSTQTQRMH
jgi:tetratricopeptide (TPR) repeat protein